MNSNELGLAKWKVLMEIFEKVKGLEFERAPPPFFAI
jgi:hypothetical protein